MTTLLLQLLQLSDTSLFDYLRPVDIVQLTLTGKECQEIIQSQRHLVRHCYWKYYGPLLAAYRVKSHAYLRLKTVQDYKVFMAETLDCDYAFYLRALALDKMRPLQEPINKLWNRAVLEVCASMGNRPWPYEYTQFNEWQEFYSSPGQYVSSHHSEVLATSQLDLLITVFRASLDNGCIQWNMQNFVEAEGKQMRYYQSSVGRYGYLYDAIKNYGLQALVITIGHFYDKNRIRVIICPDSKFVQGICRYFELGTGDQVLKALENLMKASPSFQVLLAYYTLLQEIGLSADQLDKEAHIKKSIAQIISHHNQIPVTQYDNKNWQRIHESLQIPDALRNVIYSCLTHGQVWDFIWSIDPIRSVEAGWILIELIMVYDEKHLQSYLMDFFLNKVKDGLVDEAANWLMAVLTYKPLGEYLSEYLNVELFNDQKDVIVQVFDKLAGTPEVLKNARFFDLALAFSLFSSLLDDAQLQLQILKKVIVTLSMVHDNIRDAFECFRHSQLMTIVNCLGKAKTFTQFVLNMDANTLSLCHGCVLAHVMHKYVSYYKQSEQNDKLSIYLLQLYYEIGDFRKTAAFLSALYIDHMYSDAVVQLMETLYCEEDLQQICSHLDDDCVDALRLGPEYHDAWIQMVNTAAEELPFPANIISIVQLATENCGEFMQAPDCVVNTLVDVIGSAIIRPPEERTSRFYFFDGVPYFVMKEKLVIQQYILMWSLCQRLQDRPYMNSNLVPDDSELVYGFFDYVHSSQVPEQDRQQMVETFVKYVNFGNHDSMKTLAESQAQERGYQVFAESNGFF
ncbi:hypothetical protein MP228_012772 [Amoeboaphelidium protococcarum]|nr:hypothetical protein MP228_012772 [Amoeboaphelidium protococcarum]